MRARGFVVLALFSALAACAAGPGGQSFADGTNKDDDGEGGTSRGGGGSGGATLLPDGGILLPDGAVISPPVGDGGFLGDGSAPTSRVACGGTYCRGDQSCNAGTCQFSCVGTQVPGDYATIQAAINALIGVTDTVICLKAQTYSESVSANSVATPKDLQIVGVSADRTVVNQLTISGNAFSHVTIRGVSFSNGATLSGGNQKSEFYGDKFISSGNAVYVDSVTEALFDGCDFAAGSNYSALIVERSYSTYGTTTSVTPKVTVQNSYLHDSYYGAQIAPTSSYSGSQPTLNVNLINDTFNNNTIAIYTMGGTYFPTSLNYSNDLIVNSKTYGVYLTASETAIVSKNDALFGNANNYAGSAVDGAGYVKADVKLDTSQTPPGLQSGSPALAAADPASAPSIDFWGVARPSTPDIGAVQSD